MPENGGLDVAAVRKRFLESAETLDQVRNHLIEIARIEEESSASADAMKQNAAALKFAAEQLSSLTEQMADSAKAMAATMATAQQFLERVDLTTVIASIEELKVSISGSIVSLEASFAEKVESEIENIRTALPSRWTKKST